MLFDKDQVIELVKKGLSPAEKKQGGSIELSLLAALDDIATRMKSVASVKSDTVSIAGGDRTATLSGSNDDLWQIYYLKYGTGNEQKLLTYVPVKRFLEDYDNPGIGSGIPSRYTILVTNDEGFPTIKFDVPASASDTLTVYYFAEQSAEDLSKFRSAAAVVQCTLAYFKGIGTEAGLVHYATFERLVELARSSDKFEARPEHMFSANKLDRTMNAVKFNMTNRRP